MSRQLHPLLGILSLAILVSTGINMLDVRPSVAQQAAAASNVSTPELLVVLVYDQDCHVTCTKVRPMMQQLTKSYGAKVKFAELNTGTIPESNKIAESLGVKKFFNDSTDQAPIVGIFNNSGKRIKELQGFKEKDVYQTAIDRALKQK